MRKLMVSVTAIVLTLSLVSGCVDRRGDSKSSSDTTTNQAAPKQKEPGSGSR